jgi:hypothetical protein
MEHLALLKRWYYRGRRAGEIFFADENGVLPMRRMVRGIGRVLKGEQAEEEAPPPNTSAQREITKRDGAVHPPQN